MTKKQLAGLFLCLLVPYTVGGLMMPLLPVYLSRLGIDATASGFYLAISFLALAAGSLSGGWLSDRFQKRKQTLFIGPLIAMPTIFMMGQVNHILPLTVFTMTAWYLGGLSVATVNILAGMYAAPSERGRVFGIIGTGLSIGGFVGGLASGAIVDRWGFATLFAVTATLQIGQAAASLLLEDREVKIKKHDVTVPQIPIMTMALWLVFGAAVMANMANMSTGLARPLAMDFAGFSATAVASTNAVGSILTIPLSSLLGWISDRVGRKPVLIAAYSCAIVGVVLMILSTALWHFWIATALVLIVSTSMGVGTALVTDLTEPEALGTALSRYAATPFVGGAIGFAGSGLLISNFDTQATFMVAAGIALAAVLLLIPTGRPRKVKVLAFAEVE